MKHTPPLYLSVVNLRYFIAHSFLLIGTASLTAAAANTVAKPGVHATAAAQATAISATEATAKHNATLQAGEPTAQADDASATNSALSFLSLFSAPVEEPTTPQTAQPATAQPRIPLPAKPPADNTPKTLPQPYGDPQERAAQSTRTPTDIQDWGPFYWTLAPQDNAIGMEREFAAGPFWEHRTSSTRDDVFLRPLWIDYNHVTEGRYDLHILPPAFTRRQTPLSYEWDIFLFINYARLGALEEKPLQTFMVFPFFFWHEDPVSPEKSFWGLFPIYGELIHFFSFQRWYWVAFPLYTRIQSWYDVTRVGVPYPFIQYFTNKADTARGLYLWPLYGHSELDGVYERMFWLWPLVYREIDQFHRPVPRVRQGFLPFYAFEYSEYVDDVSILMFWGWRDDSQKQYHETRYLWPLWIQGRSPERYVNRWAPFYTHSKTPHIEKWWYMWPAVQHRKVPEQGVLMERSQFFYFLYWHETQTSIEHPDLPKAEMRFVWPFYASYDNGAGISQMQVLSIFEVFFPHNRAMRDTYSPLFALYREEADAHAGLQRWSLLWNLVGSLETEREGVAQESFHIWPLYQENSRKTVEEESDSWNILFGLLGWKSSANTVAIADTPLAETPTAAAPATTAAETDTTQSASVAESVTTAAEMDTTAAPAAKIPDALTAETNDAAATTESATPAPAMDTAAQSVPPAQSAPVLPATKNTLTLFWLDIDL